MHISQEQKRNKSPEQKIRVIWVIKRIISIIQFTKKVLKKDCQAQVNAPPIQKETDHEEKQSWIYIWGYYSWPSIFLPNKNAKPALQFALMPT